MEDNTTVIPAETVNACEAWEIPTLTAVGTIVSGAGREKRKDSDAAGDPFTGPLTASKVQQIRDSARAEGFAAGQQEGYQQGMAQAQGEVEEVHTRLNQVLGHLMQPIREQDKELEIALVTLMTDIARAVVKRSVEFDAEMISEVIRQAIAELPEASQHIRILLHPLDAELVGRAIRQRASDWQVLPNPEIERGGCIIRSEHSFIDYTLDTQFQRTLEQILSLQFGSDDASAAVQSPEEPDNAN